MKFLISLCLPLLLVSCVDSLEGDSSSKTGAEMNQNEVIELDGSNVQGHYAAEIWPVNYNLHFKSIGTVGVSRDGDEFKAMVKMKYGPKDTRVRQAIYNARRCPTLEDDSNKDAYVDILEARAAIGKITVPFDGDLNSQLGGSGIYPGVGIDGKLSWSQTASFSKMFEDLKGVDENPSDQITKLADGITFPGRIVLFQGIPRKVQLPETVASPDNDSPYDTLPVGCAVLWKVGQLPVELTQE